MVIQLPSQNAAPMASIHGSIHLTISHETRHASRFINFLSFKSSETAVEQAGAANECSASLVRSSSQSLHTVESSMPCLHLSALIADLSRWTARFLVGDTDSPYHRSGILEPSPRSICISSRSRLCALRLQTFHAAPMAAQSNNPAGANRSLPLWLVVAPLASNALGILARSYCSPLRSLTRSVRLHQFAVDSSDGYFAVFGFHLDSDGLAPTVTRRQ